jgi:hypothetical protein
MRHLLTFFNILAFLFDLFFAVINHDSTPSASEESPSTSPAPVTTEEFFFNGRSQLYRHASSAAVRHS